MSIENIKIVTRKSILAKAQAQIVKQKLEKALPGLEVEIIAISTKGDSILDTPLNKIGGKGLFINELEDYILQDKADIAVHSMKDMPNDITSGLEIGAILAREDPRDIFLCKDYKSIKELPAGSKIGTSSLRRQTQILAINHEVIVEPLRGNVDTRIEQLNSGKYAAIVLAAAGLIRLGLKDWLQNPISIDEMLPAVGQGAIGVECKSDNDHIKQMLAHINDEQTNSCIQAERSMNKLLNGGCQAPIAGYAIYKHEKITLRGMVSAPNGTYIMTDMQSAAPEQAEDLGKRVAMQLIAEGASEVIAEAKQQQQNTW